MLEVINPANGDVFGQVNIDNLKSIPQCYEKAACVQKEWQESSLHERKAIIKSFSILLTKEMDDCAEVLTKEMGKPLLQAKSEIRATIDRIEWFLNNIDKNIQTEIKILKSDFPKFTSELLIVFFKRLLEDFFAGLSLLL